MALVAAHRAVIGWLWLWLLLIKAFVRGERMGRCWGDHGAECAYVSPSAAASRHQATSEDAAAAAAAETFRKNPRPTPATAPGAELRSRIHLRVHSRRSARGCAGGDGFFHNAPPSQWIHVAYIHTASNMEELLQTFSRFGTILACQRKRNLGKVRAEIKYELISSAATAIAISRENGVGLRGQTVVITYSNAWVLDRRLASALKCSPEELKGDQEHWFVHEKLRPPIKRDRRRRGGGGYDGRRGRRSGSSGDDELTISISTLHTVHTNDSDDLQYFV
uniref:RRM domain-containing protein n=1 Tax=Lotharella oceanica TaxID=641309 RepID=A0A7S2TMD9_9EUKA